MQNTIKFEMDDWVEIVEALGSKIRQIESGQLGPENQPGQDKKWIAHLLRIIRKIEGRIVEEPTSPFSRNTSQQKRRSIT